MLLAHLVPPLLPHAQPAPLDHIHLLAQLHAPHVLPATLPWLKAKLSSQNAQCVLLAMEAHQLRILDLPLAVVPFAQLARIKQLQAISRAQLALLDTQPLQQEVLLSRLALSALLAILAL